MLLMAPLLAVEMACSHASPPTSTDQPQVLATLPAVTVTTTIAAPTSMIGTTTLPPTTTSTLPATDGLRLELSGTIGGDISPKSVVASGTGLFFAQNMMYRHTITVYDESRELVKTISDAVDLGDYGITGHDGLHQGAPVEIAFTSDGAKAYVSNYQMYGDGFDHPGGDSCSLGTWDESFLYRIDTATLAIDQVIPVGAVPKYVAVTPDDSIVLVTNWCSFDLSIVDTTRAEQVTRIELGRHPRGIAVSPDSKVGYVAVMGSTDIAIVSLADFTVDWINGVGANPRHVVLSPDGAFLYATLNGDGEVVKIDTATGEIVAKVATGSAPRSMAISSDGDSLYVVNYNSDTVSKVLTSTMEEVQEVDVNHHPIGITYDPLTGDVWVANYSGSIMVFDEQ
jgi:YVTN family beta-propeller protein